MFCENKCGRDVRDAGTMPAVQTGQCRHDAGGTNWAYRRGCGGTNLTTKQSFNTLHDKSQEQGCRSGVRSIHC
jgi:hypothetical protein